MFSSVGLRECQRLNFAEIGFGFRQYKDLGPERYMPQRQLLFLAAWRVAQDDSVRTQR